jgi:iron-sulfur cluster repair protein YtfE (RIC family)
METTRKSFAEAFHNAHTALLRDLQELEKAAPKTAEQSPGDLGKLLGSVQKHLSDHFRFEEDGGYMAPVLQEEPRLAAEVRELLGEHATLATALQALIQEVGATPSLRAHLRAKVRAWVGDVRRHESRENNLVFETYYSSGATGD